MLASSSCLLCVCEFLGLQFIGQACLFYDYYYLKQRFNGPSMFLQLMGSFDEHINVPFLAVTVGFVRLELPCIWILECPVSVCVFFQ